MLANVGIPMLFVQLAYMTLVLVPVVLLEAFVFRLRLGLPWRTCIVGAGRANLVSTFIGFPIAWVVFFVMQLMVGGGSAWGLDTLLQRLAAVTIQAPWLIPYEKHLFWMIPAASLVLLLPCFPLSVFIERKVLAKNWSAVEKKQLSISIWIANGISYLILIIIGILRLCSALNHYPPN